MPEPLDTQPLFVGVGLCDARIFIDPAHRVAVLELHFASIRRALDRGGMREVRRRGQWDMTFGGEQAGGRIEADPAGARQIDLGPRMEIAEIRAWSYRAVERLDVLDQLHEIAGHEAAREAEVTQDLHEQPCAVSTRAAAARERFFARLDAGFEAHDVVDVTFEALIERDQKVDGRRGLAIDGGDPRSQQRTALFYLEIRDQIAGEFGVVGDRKIARTLLEKEIERVDRDHVRDHFDVYPEMSRFLREHQAREEIVVRILLPVNEVIAGFDA